MDKRLKTLLPVMRWAVIGCAIAILVFSIVGLFRFPEYAARHPQEFTPNDLWTGAQVQQGLADLGWSPLTAAWIELGRELFGLLLFYSIAAVLLWKKSTDWFGLILMTVFVIISPSSGVLFTPVIEVLPGLSFFYEFFGAVGWQLFFLLFFFFPNGRPVPAWTGWFATCYAVLMLAEQVFAGLSGLIGSFAGPLMVILAIGSQVYRYIRRSDAVQRQQSKWVVFALGYFLLLLPVGYLFGFQAPPADHLGTALMKEYVIKILLFSGFWLVPAAITIAVLRYRLWDIDLIIRRTLLYGLLSGLLGLVYLGSVVLLRQLLGGLTGQSSAALVFSTLLIAALSSPLRRGLQGAIDRRFFRQKYDAERAVAAFAAAARSETALDTLTGHMVDVVKQTVQPETVWVWIKDSRRGP